MGRVPLSIWTCLVGLLFVAFCVVAILFGLSGQQNYRVGEWFWLVDGPNGSFNFVFIGQFGVVLDCGSSHTSIFVYKWAGEKWHGTGQIDQTDTSCTVAGKGISSYGDGSDPTLRPELAGPALGPCLQWAAGKVPTDQHGETPIYVGATAGMRLLRARDPVASGKVLASVREALQMSPFLYSDSDQVQIISGADEGAFAWITVNYLLGHLQHSSDGNSALKPVEGHETVGALDLGGASTQIAFMPNPDEISLMPAKNSENLQLYDNRFNIYSDSFLCYGAEQARAKYRARSVLGETSACLETNCHLEDACRPRGSSELETVSEIFSKPCTRISDPANLGTFGPVITPPPSLQNYSQFDFNGSSSFSLCDRSVSNLFNQNQSHVCSYSFPHPSCSFNSHFLPRLRGSFVAFSNYYFTGSFLGLIQSNDGLVTPSEFYEAAKNICSLSLQEISKYDRKEKEKQFWPNYCFNSLYIYHLLTDGLKFASRPTEKSIKIQLANGINGVDVGWTLGFMINTTNRLPSHYRSVNLSSTVVVVLFSMLAVTGCLLIGCLVVDNRMQVSPRLLRRLSFSSIRPGGRTVEVRPLLLAEPRYSRSRLSDPVV